MKALKLSGYDGWCVIEAFGRALPDLAAATRVCVTSSPTAMRSTSLVGNSYARNGLKPDQV
jgi:sugar phosphate isomerase/epimerase